MAFEELKERQGSSGEAPRSRTWRARSQTCTRRSSRRCSRPRESAGSRWPAEPASSATVAARRGAERGRHRPRARPDRDGEATGGRRRSGDRLPGRRCGESRARGRELRRGHLDLRRHVRARPAAGCGGARPGDEARRSARAGYVDADGRRRSHVQDDGLVPAAASRRSAAAPLDWGRPEHVEQLLGDAFELAFDERVTTVEFESADEYWQEFSANFGPMKTLLGTLDDARREELRRDWTELFESSPFGSPGGPVSHTREYLLITGTRV